VRQRLMFAATMPDDIRRLAKDVLRTPVTVQVNSPAPAATVAHALYPVASHLKTALLLQLLRHTDTASVLNFTRTKHRAQRLGDQIERAGYPTTSLQGNLSQNQRQAAIRGFRNGSYRVLVATDIAARGIDVSRISHVINYDMPDTTDAYTHRIGRTGRAEKTGDAFSLVTREDEAMVRSIENVLGTRLERRRLNGFDYQSPAPRARDNESPGQRQVARGHSEHERTFSNRTVPSRPARSKDTYSKASPMRLILSHSLAAGTAGAGCRSSGFAESHEFSGESWGSRIEKKFQKRSFKENFSRKKPRYSD